MPESTPESTSPIDAPLTPEEREAIRNAFADLCASREELTRIEEATIAVWKAFDSLDRSADRSVDREGAESTRLPPDRWKRVTNLLERALQMLPRVALASMLVGSSFFLWRVVPHLISKRAAAVTTAQPQPKGEQG
jgi:hypothetical protein